MTWSCDCWLNMVHRRYGGVRHCWSLVWFWVLITMVILSIVGIHWWLPGAQLSVAIDATMRTSSHANVFRITGFLCGKIGQWWFTSQKASNAKLWCFPGWLSWTNPKFYDWGFLSEIIATRKDVEKWKLSPSATVKLVNVILLHLAFVACLRKIIIVTRELFHKQFMTP